MFMKLLFWGFLALLLLLFKGESGPCQTIGKKKCVYETIMDAETYLSEMVSLVSQAIGTQKKED